ncbi:MAG: hypothetical protein JXQ73_28305 [Phycisphaerae bacterium]|nr:hypothetical protein [Phycisphaerae bacterium]
MFARLHIVLGSALAAAGLVVLADATVKGVAVLIVAALAVVALRRGSAAARHLVWTSAVVGLLLLPVLSLGLPSWRVLPGWVTLEPTGIDETVGEPPQERVERKPGVEFDAPKTAAIPIDALLAGMTASCDEAAALGEMEGLQTDTIRRDAPWGSETRLPLPMLLPADPCFLACLGLESALTLAAQPGAFDSFAEDRAGRSIAVSAAQSSDEHSSERPWWIWVFPVWLGGCMAVLLRLGLGRMSLWRLQRTSQSITGGAWADLLDRASAEVGLEDRVRLLMSPRRAMPMTWGVLRAKLLLPAEAEGWSADRRRAVLLHELAHVKRWDCLTQLLGQLACAAYWFNPLVWMAARRMISESEHACDDLVLRKGAAAPDYAEHVLQVAARFRDDHVGSRCAIALARPSHVEGRLLAILDKTRNRRAVSRAAGLASLLVLLCLVVPLATARSAGQSDASLGGGEATDNAAAQPTSARDEDVVAVGAGFTSGGGKYGMAYGGGSSSGGGKYGNLRGGGRVSAREQGDSKLPEGTTCLSSVGDKAGGKRSLACSGHAVRFDAPEGARFVEAVDIFADRYGHPKAPKEDFHVYILNEKMQVLADATLPYSTIERAGKLRWYTLRTPSIEVPGTFYVALSFDPHRTKGIFLGYDKNVKETRSLIGLPEGGFKPVEECYEWMVRARVAGKPSGANGIRRLADQKPPAKGDAFKDLIEAKQDSGSADGKQSYGGSGPAVRFELKEILPQGAPPKDAVLHGLRVHASRYGGGYDASKSMVTVAALDGKNEPVRQWTFPYAEFGRTPKWVDLVLPEPAPLEALCPDGKTLTIAIDPEATQSRGIFFRYSKAEGGAFGQIWSPKKKTLKPVSGRIWMIRAYVGVSGKGEADEPSALGVPRSTATEVAVATSAVLEPPSTDAPSSGRSGEFFVQGVFELNTDIPLNLVAGTRGRGGLWHASMIRFTRREERLYANLSASWDSLADKRWQLSTVLLDQDRNVLARAYRTPETQYIVRDGLGVRRDREFGFSFGGGVPVERIRCFEVSILPLDEESRPYRPGSEPLSASGKGKLTLLRERTTGRRYWLYLPGEYLAQQKKGVRSPRHPETKTGLWPLVATFHGGRPFDGCLPQAQEWQQEADRYGFIVAAPQLYTPDLFMQFPLKDPSLRELRDDERCLLAIVGEVLEHMPADKHRVLATSWFSGGYLAHYMVNRHPELFSCLAVRQSEFSADILEPTQVGKYKDMPIGVFWTKSDPKACREESELAVTWYRQRGFRDVSWGVFNGARHRRIPEIAAGMFAMQCGIPPRTPAAIPYAVETGGRTRWALAYTLKVPVGRSAPQPPTRIPSKARRGKKLEPYHPPEKVPLERGPYEPPGKAPIVPIAEAGSR